MFLCRVFGVSRNFLYCVTHLRAHIAHLQTEKTWQQTQMRKKIIGKFIFAIEKREPERPTCTQYESLSIRESCSVSKKLTQRELSEMTLLSGKRQVCGCVADVKLLCRLELKLSVISDSRRYRMYSKYSQSRKSPQNFSLKTNDKICLKVMEEWANRIFETLQYTKHIVYMNGKTAMIP